MKPADRDGGVKRWEYHATIQGSTDRVDADREHLGEIRDGSPADPLSLAPCLVQEDCRRGRSVRDDINVEGYGLFPYMVTSLRVYIRSFKSMLIPYIFFTWK